MRLIITRHGQTNSNFKKIIQNFDSELSEDGILQAKKLAQRFRIEKIDYIFSSDLIRAVDTANEIMKYHPNLILNKDIRIRERSFGSLEGTSSSGIDWNNPPKEFEQNDSLRNRVSEFLSDISNRYYNKTVLVVCHTGIKNTFIKILENLNSEYNEKIKNTSVSEFILDVDGKFKSKYINCLKHLEVESELELNLEISNN